MKKAIIISSILFGITFGAFAQGGMFGYGDTRETGCFESRGGGESLINLPSSHGETTDASPIGSGALLLIGFGAAYALKKKNEK